MITVWKKIIDGCVEHNHIEDGHVTGDKPRSLRYMLRIVKTKEDIKIWNKRYDLQEKNWSKHQWKFLHL